jgi:hypothetical protein
MFFNLVYHALSLAPSQLVTELFGSCFGRWLVVDARADEISLFPIFNIISMLFICKCHPFSCH